MGDKETTLLSSSDLPIHDHEEATANGTGLGGNNGPGEMVGSGDRDNDTALLKSQNSNLLQKTASSISEV